MNNILEYKGYHAKIVFDSKDMILRGKIEGISDLVNFESDSIGMIEQEFHLAVDDYLVFCEEIGKTPEKEYKGTFNVRITPQLHRDLAMISLKKNDSLNTSVEKAIEKYVSNEKQELEQLKDKVDSMEEVLNSTVYKVQKASTSFGSNVIDIKDYKLNYREEFTQ